MQIVVLLACFTVGCDSSEKSSPDAAFAADAQPDATAPDAPQMLCTIEDQTVTQGIETFGDTDIDNTVVAAILNQDIDSIWVVFPRQAPFENGLINPGTYDVDEAFVWGIGDMSNGMIGQFFKAFQGTVVVNAATPNSLDVTIQNAVLQEVADDDLDAMPIPDGCEFSLPPAFSIASTLDG